MSHAVVQPSSISGNITPPPSKSAAHRALICATLAGGGVVHGIHFSEDMNATLQAITAMGLTHEISSDTITITKAERSPHLLVDCGESGSTLRFFIPIFAALGLSATFIGHGRLPMRTLNVYEDCLPKQGVSLVHTSESWLPLQLNGKLKAGDFTLRGDVSSQFISGLLFALPLCDGDSRIILSGPPESAGYITMTLDALKAAGITVTAFSDGWEIPGNQHYTVQEVTVERDWSQAAFLLAMGALSGKVTIEGISVDSHQGDRQIVSLLEQFGATIRKEDNQFTCVKSSLHGIDIDASQIPDLVPILAVLASAADGVTRIYNAARLRMKESDRLAAVSDCLHRLGASVEEREDSLLIHGGCRLTGGEVLGYNDHRIVMSMAVAALLCDSQVTISDAHSIQKSWPTFFEDYKKLGGIADVVADR